MMVTKDADERYYHCLRSQVGSLVEEPLIPPYYYRYHSNGFWYWKPSTEAQVLPIPFPPFLWQMGTGRESSKTFLSRDGGINADLTAGVWLMEWTPTAHMWVRAAIPFSKIPPALIAWSERPWVRTTEHICGFPKCVILWRMFEETQHERVCRRFVSIKIVITVCIRHTTYDDTTSSLD